MGIHLPRSRILTAFLLLAVASLLIGLLASWAQEPAPTQAETKTLTIEERQLELEREKLRSEEQRDAATLKSETWRGWGTIGGLFAVFLLSLLTFLANQDASRYERFREMIRSFAQIEKDTSLRLRLAATHALPQWCKTRQWMPLWGRPYKREVVIYLADSLKERLSRNLERERQAKAEPGESISIGKIEPPEETTFYSAVATTIRGISYYDSEAFAQVNISETDLRELDLSGVHLERAYLAGAHMEGASLYDAYLQSAKLMVAHLEEAQLWDAHLEGANLRRAHMERANLSLAYLHGAFLAEAHAGGADFEGADLRGTHLECTDLRGAKLRWARLEGARLAGAHLEGAHLEGAKLNGARMIGVHLEGAHFSRDTILPDGRHWTPDTDVMKLANPAEEKSEDEEE